MQIIMWLHRGSEIGSLHNKHGYARGEHRHRGDCHDGPSQAGTWLALHQFLVRRDDQDCDQKKGRQQSVDDRCPVECLHRVDACKVQSDAHSG